MQTSPKIIRVVVGIIRQAQKILIAERPLHQPYSGFWEFPGGKIEANESDCAALKRELFEELGIQVEAAHHLFSHQHTYPDKTVDLAIWQVTSFSGEASGKEGQTLCWADRKTLLSLNVLEGNRGILERVMG